MRALKVLLISAGVVLAFASSAPAETNSRPDGTDHPYVGMFVGDFSSTHPGLEAGCPGTLISAAVFLTAAHCIDGRPERQAVPLFVTFDSEWSYPGSPSDLHAVATYDWNPLFDAPGFGTRHDNAVLTLEGPVSGIAPAGLAAPGVLEELRATGALFDSVGYGMQGFDRGDGPPQPIGNPPVSGLWQRRAATSRFAALTPDTLHLLTEDAIDLGGNCYADSGGPHLLGGTDVVAATSSWIDTMCEALSANPRVDSADARAFLGGFVSLP